MARFSVAKNLWQQKVKKESFSRIAVTAIEMFTS